MTKKTNKKIDRRIDEVMKHAMIIGSVNWNANFTFNGIPVSDDVRRLVINDELTNLLSAMGITAEQQDELTQDYDWSESSPEGIELNNAVEKAVMQVQQLIQADSENDEDDN